MVEELPHHVEPSILVEEEVLEYHRSNEYLHLLLDNQVIDDSVHEGKLLAGDLVTILHGNEDVSTRSEHSQQLRQGRGIDLARCKAIGGGNDIIGLIIDRDGTKTIQVSMDVVLEDALGPGLAQHAKRGVQAINVAVSMAANLSTQEASASSQVQDLHLMVQTKLEECISTLDIAIVVAHHHQVIIILGTPVIIELDGFQRVSIISEHGLYLLLQLLGGGAVKVVREPSGQSLDNIELSSYTWLVMMIQCCCW